MSEQIINRSALCHFDIDPWKTPEGGYTARYRTAESHGFGELRAILDEGYRIIVKAQRRIDYEVPGTGIGRPPQSKKQWVLPNRYGEITEVHFSEDPIFENKCACKTEIYTEDYNHVLLTWYVGKPPAGREDFYAISAELEGLVVCDIMAPPLPIVEANKTQPLLFSSM